MIYKLPQISLSNVESVYVGKPGKCMCGCSGKYTYSRECAIRSGKEKGYTVRKEEIDDARVARVINKVRTNASLGIEVHENKIFTVIIGKTQYTIYLFAPISVGNTPNFMNL